MTTEAEAVAALVEQGNIKEPVELDAGKVFSALTPAEAVRDTIDTERYADTPRRPRGTVAVHDASSFLAAVGRLRTDDEQASVYADEEGMSLVAVLNDDGFGNAGWRDHRVTLTLRPTEEWKHWKGNQGLGEQQKFAEVIETGLDEIVEPTAADMLDLAQTFQATVAATFRQGGVIATGARQFTYDEDVAAKAGKAGTLEIPDQFKLGVKPFYGSPAYEVVARLRYRLRDGKLSIGYDLTKAHEVERSAFRDVVTTVADGLPENVAPIFAGVAPGPTA